MTRPTQAHRQSASRPLHKLVLCAAAVLLGAAASDTWSKEFYRWQDDEGVTHYSAHPPKDRSATKVRATNTKVEAPQETAAGADTEANQDDKLDAGQTSGSANERPAPDPERCAAAERNVKALQENARVRIKENGAYRFLSPEEMQEKLRIARKILADEC